MLLSFLASFDARVQRVDERLRSERYVAWWLFVAAFVAKVVWVMASRHDLAIRVPIMDSKYYDDWARSVAAGHGMKPGAFFMGPLYPSVLAVVYRLFGADYTVARIVQSAGGAATVAITYLLGRRVFRPSVALLASVFLLLYGAITFYEGMLLMAWLGTVLNVTALYVLVRGAENQRVRTFALAGLIIGASALARASILLFVPFVIVWIARVVVTSRGRSIAAFTACVLLVVSIATIHNAISSRDFVLVTSNGGFNFYVGNSRDAVGIFYPPPGVDFVGDSTTRIYIERKLGRDLKPSQISQYWLRKAVSEIAADPGHELRVTARKIALFLNGYEVPQLESFALATHRSMVLRLLFVRFWFLIVAGLLGMALAPRRRNYVLLAGFAGVYAVSIIAFFVTARYRVQIAPVLALFAAYAILVGLPRVLKNRARIAPVVFALITLTAVTRPTLFTRSQEEDRFRDYIHRGRRLAMVRDFPSALADIDSAIAIYPNFAEGYIHRAIVNNDAGRHFQAIEDYARANRLHPGMASVHYDLAQTLRRANMNSEAIKEYRAALRIDPVMIKSQNNLGIALREQKDYPDAIASFRRVIQMDPGYAKGYNNLGSCLAEADSMHEAVKVFEQATHRFPKYAIGYKNLAMAWASLKNPWKAIVAIEGYIQLRPDDRSAHEMLRKLRIAARAAEGKPIPHPKPPVPTRKDSK